MRVYFGVRSVCFFPQDLATRASPLIYNLSSQGIKDWPLIYLFLFLLFASSPLCVYLRLIRGLLLWSIQFFFFLLLLISRQEQLLLGQGHQKDVSIIKLLLYHTVETCLLFCFFFFNLGVGGLGATQTTGNQVLVCDKIYGAQSGDNCFSIALQFNLTTEFFASLNPNLNCNHIFIGEWLCVDGLAFWSAKWIIIMSQ